MREFLQVFSFLIYLGIVVISMYNAIKFKRSHWFNFTIYGILGCVFYVLVFFHVENIHEYSALLRTLQSSIVIGYSAGILLGRRG